MGDTHDWARINGDTEMAHIDADDAIVAFLRVLGYGDIADAWDKVDKWYA